MSTPSLEPTLTEGVESHTCRAKALLEAQDFEGAAREGSRGLDILPHLAGIRRAESDLKSGLVILLGEAVAEVVWAALREAREDMPGDDRGTTVLSNLFELQKALDAPHTDEEHVKWVRLLQKLAQKIVARVKEMAEENPGEWKKAGAMPEGCEIGDPPLKDGKASGGGTVVEDVGLLSRTWATKLSSVLERAVLRTLRRQPTRRVDIYDQFVELWLEREIKKVMGQRGIAVTPQQLHLEVRVGGVVMWCMVASQVLNHAE